jgi:hypothetical protein
MTKLKALSVLECRAYVLEKYGPEGILRVQNAMCDAGRMQVYSEALLAVDWVDVEYAVEHAVVIDAVFGAGDGKVAFAMISELTARHFRGIYRAIMVAPNPQEGLERSGRLWRRYYDDGETFVDFPMKNFATKRLVGCSHTPKRHEWLFMPYYAEVVRQAGGSDVTTKHVRCVVSGAESCLTEITWK